MLEILKYATSSLPVFCGTVALALLVIVPAAILVEQTVANVCRVLLAYAPPRKQEKKDNEEAT